MLNLIFKKSKIVLSLLVIFISAGYRLDAQPNTAKSKDYFFTIESYYKVKWGHGAEFVNLWKMKTIRYTSLTILVLK